MIIINLLIGLCIGAFSPLDMNLLISLGSLLIPHINNESINISGFILGITNTILIKNIAGTYYSSHFKITKNKKESYFEAKQAVWTFITTLVYTSVPLYILERYGNLHKVIMPMSICIIIWKGYYYLITKEHSNESKKQENKLINIILTIIIFIIARCIIQADNASATYLYFLCFLTIPNLIFPMEETNKSTNQHREKIFSVDSFIYGSSSNKGPILNAILLSQTILWGSAKDTLAALINNEKSYMLDEYRIPLLIFTIGFLLIYNAYGLDHFLLTIHNKKFNHTKIISYIICGIGLITNLHNVNPILAFSLITVGIGLIIFTKKNINNIKCIVIPALLCMSITVR